MAEGGIPTADTQEAPADGPRAWNKLPPPLRLVHSATSFKRQLKTFLFNNAFNLHC